jgi:hypothetical protein
MSDQTGDWDNYQVPLSSPGSSPLSNGGQGVSKFDPQSPRPRRKASGLLPPLVYLVIGGVFFLVAWLGDWGASEGELWTWEDTVVTEGHIIGVSSRPVRTPSGWADVEVKVYRYRDHLGTEHQGEFETGQGAGASRVYHPTTPFAKPEVVEIRYKRASPEKSRLASEPPRNLRESWLYRGILTVLGAFLLVLGLYGLRAYPKT